MAKGTPFTIGADVSCADGVCGQVSRVVVDPAALAVTYLAVEPKHQPGPGRLVPVGLAAVTAGGIRLRCTVAEFSKLSPAQKTEFLPGTGDFADYGPEQVHGVAAGSHSRDKIAERLVTDRVRLTLVWQDS
jgi:hypothetical protein